MEIKAEFKKYPYLISDLSFSRKYKIQSIPAMSFVDLTFNELDLSSNNLNLIDANAFKGSLGVNELILDTNKIEDLTFLEHVINLKKLDLNDNKIRDIKSQTFLKMNQLEYLSLQKNQISTLEPDIFRNLNVLAYLDVSFNKIQVFNQQFPVTSHLEHLDLSNNLIKSFDSVSFKGLSTLRDLILSNNQIEKIKNRIFHPDLMSLTNLELKNNSINEIEIIITFIIRVLREIGTV
jgi:Leucine-rich repeat (LRR) protein